LPVETLREGELLGVGERLVSKHQYRVFIHAIAQPVECASIGDVTQIHGANLRADRWM